MDRQATLFDPPDPLTPEARADYRQRQGQDAELARVSSRIGRAVLEFVTERLAGSGEFHAEELHAHVRRECNAAPASADRILRLLRRQGAINYEVVNRSQSLYRALAD